LPRIAAAVSVARLVATRPLGPHTAETAQYDATAIQHAIISIRFITLFTVLRPRFFTGGGRNSDTVDNRKKRD